MTERDDAAKLAELRRELPPLDLDDATALRIAHRARAAVGRGLPAGRFVEPVLIATFEVSLLVWLVVKLIYVLG